jgi:hypothetical protein
MLDTRNLLLATATSSLDNRTEVGDTDSFRLNQACYIPPLWAGKGMVEPGTHYATESGTGQWFRLFISSPETLWRFPSL